MAKEAVLGYNPFSMYKDMSLKKYFLFFDTVYIDYRTIGYLLGRFSYKKLLESSIYNGDKNQIKIPPVLNLDSMMNSLERQQFDLNLRNLQYLSERGVIQYVNWRDLYDKQKAIGVKELLETIGFQKKVYTGIEKKDRERSWQNLSTWYARAISIMLAIDGKKDLVSLVNEIPDFQMPAKKQPVLNFILEKIPEPDDSVSWEQLRDFKADQDTKASYYALIKWINETARKSLPMQEIQDEYEYLYHQYANQYQIHKLKQKSGIIEVLVTGGLDLLNGKLGSVMTGLFSIFKKEIELMEAESKFTGREIAYIHKLEQKF